MNTVNLVDEFRFAAPGFTASACRAALDRVSALALAPTAEAVQELARLTDQALRAERAIQAAEQASAQGSEDIAAEQWNASFVLIDELGYTASAETATTTRFEDKPRLIKTPAIPA